MLDWVIIEDLKRRERERRERSEERPRLELPLPPDRRQPEEKRPESGGTVIVIDL